MMKALLALLGLILVVLALLFPYGGQAAAVDGREALLRSEAGITSIESGSTGHTSADGERGRPEAASAGRGEDPLGGVPQRIAAMDPEAWTVRGVIIDSYGEPVPGAMIGDAEDNAPVACDDEGSFVLQHAPGLERLELLAMAPQHTPKLVSVVRDPAAQHADIGEVRMLRGASLSGLVQGPGQVPFAGAKVRLLLYRSSDGPTSEVLRKLSPVQITGSRGEYSFEHLVPGFYGIDAVAEGMQRGQGASLELDDGKRYEAQTIVLVRGYRLRGRVVDVEGAPIADARVGARTGIGAPRYALVMQTDADGRFEMAGAPPAELSIGVSKEGYLSQSVEADPTSAKELEIQLEPGLQITGIVTSAETRAPVESFAVTLRRVADVDPRRGSVTQQLEAQIQSWRDQALSSTDPEQRKQRLARSAEFEERLRRVREMARTRPVAILRGPGSVAGAPAEGKPEQGADSMQQEGGVQSWPKGRFTLEGLSEGIYVVGIRTGTSEFCYAEHPPVELRRHAPAPELRFALEPGNALGGFVADAKTRKRLAGVQLELVEITRSSESARKGLDPIFPWLFGERAPGGQVVQRTRSASDGRYTFGWLPLAPARYSIHVSDPRYADTRSPVIESAGRHAIPVWVHPRSVLEGRVRDVQPGVERSFEVVAIGGLGSMHRAEATKDGSYRLEGLQPGSYLVRAFPKDDVAFERRFFRALFPLHHQAIDKKDFPPLDVTLAPGETRKLDVKLVLPPTGTVRGSITVNGQIEKYLVVYLRPVASAKDRARHVTLRARYLPSGAFEFKNVPEGQYTLHAYGPTREELHRQELEVTAGTDQRLDLALQGAGLRGSIRTDDGSDPAQLRGYVWILPGAKEAPADLWVYRRSHRVHRIRVRNGVYEDKCLSLGPALLVLDLRDRERIVRRIEILSGPVQQLDLTAGKSRQ